MEAQLVDGDVVSPGVVLHGSSQEGLGEEEARQPEHSGFGGAVPLLLGT